MDRLVVAIDNPINCKANISRQLYWAVLQYDFGSENLIQVESRDNWDVLIRLCSELSIGGRVPAHLQPTCLNQSAKIAQCFN